MNEIHAQRFFCGSWVWCDVLFLNTIIDQIFIGKKEDPHSYLHGTYLPTSTLNWLPSSGAENGGAVAIGIDGDKAM